MKVNSDSFEVVSKRILSEYSQFPERSDLVSNLSKNLGIGYKACWDIVNYVLDVMPKKK